VQEINRRRCDFPNAMTISALPVCPKQRKPADPDINIPPTAYQANDSIENAGSTSNFSAAQTPSLPMPSSASATMSKGGRKSIRQLA
jgi:hypothetical protein